MPKLPLAHVLPVLSAIFLAAASVLSVALSLALAHPRFGQQRFAKRAGFTPMRLTRRSSGSAAPPPELRR